MAKDARGEESRRATSTAAAERPEQGRPQNGIAVFDKLAGTNSTLAASVAPAVPVMLARPLVLAEPAEPVDPAKATVLVEPPEPLEHVELAQAQGLTEAQAQEDEKEQDRMQARAYVQSLICAGVAAEAPAPAQAETEGQAPIEAPAPALAETEGQAPTEAPALADSQESGTTEVPESGGDPRGAPMTRSWEFVIQGELDGEDEDSEFTDKAFTCFPVDALERMHGRGVAFACVRGVRAPVSKNTCTAQTGSSLSVGSRKMTPNQDDFLLSLSTFDPDGLVALYGVFDGRGAAGHECAAFLRGRLPERIFADAALFSRPEATLRRAVRHTQRALSQQPFASQASGAGLTVVLLLAGSANASARAGASARGTAEAAEAPPRVAFVLRAGAGCAVLVSRCDGAQEGPGGSFKETALVGGGASAGESGKAGELECARRALRQEDLLLLLGTERLFEVMGAHEMGRELMHSGVSTAVVQDLCAEAVHRLEQPANRAAAHDSDDVTAIVVSLAP